MIPSSNLTNTLNLRLDNVHFHRKDLYQNHKGLHNFLNLLASGIELLSHRSSWLDRMVERALGACHSASWVQYPAGLGSAPQEAVCIHQPPIDAALSLP